MRAMSAAHALRVEPACQRQSGSKENYPKPYVFKKLNRFVLDFGFWVLDFGFWVLDFGFWVLEAFIRQKERKPFGFWILGCCFWVLDFGFWVLGFGFWVWILDFGFPPHKKPSRKGPSRKGLQEPPVRGPCKDGVSRKGVPVRGKGPLKGRRSRNGPALGKNGPFWSTAHKRKFPPNSGKVPPRSFL